MVSVRSTALPVYSEEIRPHRSTVSNDASPHKNSHAHTPTVNAGSSLAVADTILLFLSTLRPSPEMAFPPHSDAAEEPETARYRSVQADAELQRDFRPTNPPEMNEIVEPPGQGDIEPSTRSSADVGPDSNKNTDRTISSLLLELMNNPASSKHANTEHVSGQQGIPQEPAWKRTTGSFSESYVMSQTSIALMFGLSVDEKSLQQKTAVSAQNDNRASARYRQQSPDSWSSQANTNINTFVSSERNSRLDRGQILRATFTEAGTYQFG